MDYYEGSGSSLANLTLFVNGSDDYEGNEVFADHNITANRTDDEVSGLLALFALLMSVFT